MPDENSSFLEGLGDVKMNIEKEKIYPKFAKLAREEGFQEIADFFANPK